MARQKRDEITPEAQTMSAELYGQYADDETNEIPANKLDDLRDLRETALMLEKRVTKELLMPIWKVGHTFGIEIEQKAWEQSPFTNLAWQLSNLINALEQVLPDTETDTE
jgi:hypothetical protein